MEGYVYILQSQKNAGFYIGSTNNLQRRILEHTKGYVTAMRNLTPWTLVLSQQYQILTDARKMEWKIKKQKSKVRLQKMVDDQNITMGQ